MQSIHLGLDLSWITYCQLLHNSLLLYFCSTPHPSSPAMQPPMDTTLAGPPTQAPSSGAQPSQSQAGTSGDPPAGDTATSSFPLPPMHLVHQYTNEMVAAGAAPLPPPLPTDGVYWAFGERLSLDEPILRSLESQGIKQLYASNSDPRSELKRLVHSAVAAFLDLLHILITCPESAERQRKIDDIRLLFINVHHLINEYRPQQARETLYLMMQLQKKERSETAERLRQHMSQMRSELEKCLAALPADVQLCAELRDQGVRDWHQIDGALKTAPSSGNVPGGGHSQLHGAAASHIARKIINGARVDCEPDLRRKDVKFDEIMCDFVDREIGLNVKRE